MRIYKPKNSENFSLRKIELKIVHNPGIQH
jgi:hypothetical protein